MAMNMAYKSGVRATPNYLPSGLFFHPPTKNHITHIKMAHLKTVWEISPKIFGFSYTSQEFFGPTNSFFSLHVPGEFSCTYRISKVRCGRVKVVVVQLGAVIKWDPICQPPQEIAGPNSRPYYGKPMGFHSPLIRPYFLGWGSFGGGTLGSQ